MAFLSIIRMATVIYKFTTRLRRLLDHTIGKSGCRYACHADL